MFLIALHGSAPFRAALVKKLSGMAIAEFIGAWLEVHTEEGETDLLLKVLTGAGERLAIVIQVKIDPSFRERQSERCRSRGKMGRAQGHWDRFSHAFACPSATPRFACGSATGTMCSSWKTPPKNSRETTNRSRPFWRPRYVNPPTNMSATGTSLSSRPMHFGCAT